VEATRAVIDFEVPGIAEAIRARGLAATPAAALSRGIAAVAGRGIIPGALALAVDHCFQAIGLHRIEVNVRPENAPSRRVAEKLGFRDEGIRRAFLHIDGGWRDHVSYAITAGEVPEGMISRWRTLQHA
jgi:L-amino acid N-acyltransferase YncA